MKKSKCDTKTPIHHLVVIFQENRSFDHYFGTYPFALNPPGEPAFFAKPNTPTVDGLRKSLLINNQNLVNPFRLSRQQATTLTGSPSHNYEVLQLDMDKGLMDRFVQNSGSASIPHELPMSFFDGNTVTSLWNYAQHFAMSDNFHTSSIGPSTIGAINLISGQTHGALPPNLISGGGEPIVVQGTIINDADPLYDVCSAPGPKPELTGRNIGNLLTDNSITWGWFQGGFENCNSSHIGPTGKPVIDYVPHHNPFQYYKSTSNPQHLPPSSPLAIGFTDQANHLYGLDDFWIAASLGHIPSVSFLKSRAFENGHAGNSTPLLEQQFLVNTINALQLLPEWKNMAIIIAYDDPGGFYDHQMPP